jgi:hypothetical protein
VPARVIVRRAWVSFILLAQRETNINGSIDSNSRGQGKRPKRKRRRERRERREV